MIHAESMLSETLPYTYFSVTTYRHSDDGIEVPQEKIQQRRRDQTKMHKLPKGSKEKA